MMEQNGFLFCRAHANRGPQFTVVLANILVLADKKAVASFIMRGILVIDLY